MEKLPVMQCDKNCGACCGHVIVQESEFQRIEKYARENSIFPLRQGTTCSFYQNGECAIYPVRPWICRVFGHFADERLTCPRGYNTNVDAEKRRRMEADYALQGVGQPMIGTWLFSYTDEEFSEIIQKELGSVEEPSSLERSEGTARGVDNGVGRSWSSNQ